MKLPLILNVALLLALIPAASRAETQLDILNANGTSSSISVTAGQSFSAEVYVSGLTAPLHNFDLTFAGLPAGVTLASFTDEVPTGWVPLSDVAAMGYGASNVTGSDITGSAELVLANFTTSTSATSGTLTFTSPGMFQDLTSDNNVPISYNLNPAALTVNAAPEPSSWILALGGCLFVAFIQSCKGKFRRA